MHKPLRYLERLITQALPALPAATPERTEAGYLHIKWDAPCPEIQALWLTILHNEVVLSCGITHTHYSWGRYWRLRLSGRRLKQRIAGDVIKELKRFLHDGSVVFDSTQGGRGWCRRDRLWETLLADQQHFGAESYRAWAWSGELDLSSQQP